MDSNLTEQVKAFLLQNSVPTFGIASAALLETEPQGIRPSDALDFARSLVCLGLPVPKGVLRSAGRSEALYWRTANVYYRHIDALLIRAASILEDQNEAAVPIFGCFPYDIKGKGDMWGYLDLIRAGEAAGLGLKGKNGLLFNSRYGPRLLLGAIVTTADLEPTTMPEQRQCGCPDDCFVCLENCPAGAIDREGRVNGPACTMRSSISPMFSHLMKAGKPQPEDLQMINHVAAVDDHSWYACIKCVADCPHM